MPNFDENEPLEIVKPVITNPVKVRTTRTVPEVGQNDLAEFAQRLLGKPLESDMQRALSLLERQQADFVAYVERQRADGAALMRQLLGIFAEAAPSMPKAVEALTTLPVPGSADPRIKCGETETGNNPSAQKPAETNGKPATRSEKGRNRASRSGSRLRGSRAAEAAAVLRGKRRKEKRRRG